MDLFFLRHVLGADTDSLIECFLHSEKFLQPVGLFHTRRAFDAQLGDASLNCSQSPLGVFGPGWYSLAHLPGPQRHAELLRFALFVRGHIKEAMLPSFMVHGGLALWLLLLASAVAIAVFIERLVHYHRAQINSAEFLNGVRTVLGRENVVEAISICDATPGPVPRLVKAAILNRDYGRERVREAIEQAGLLEVPRLEEKLSLLATIAQIAPLLGLLGTVLGMIDVFGQIEKAGLYAQVNQLSSGLWRALICTAAGLGVAIPSYAGYNYLVHRVNEIVLDMERAAAEIVHIVTEKNERKPA